MKMDSIFSAILFLLVCLSRMAAASEEFESEVHSYLSNVSDEGIFDAFYPERAAEQKRQLAEDSRDWEGVLTKMLDSDDPKSVHVFTILKARDTSDDPRIVRSVCRQLSRLAEATRLLKPGNPEYESAERSFQGRFFSAIDSKQPDILLFLLENINRPESGFSRMIDGVTYEHLVSEWIASDNEELIEMAKNINHPEGSMTGDLYYDRFFQVLGSAGGKEHLKELAKLLETLRHAGRKELALEAEKTSGVIKRRIEDPSKKRASSQSSSTGGNEIEASESNESVGWASGWLLALIGSLLFVTGCGIYVIFKRKQNP